MHHLNDFSRGARLALCALAAAMLAACGGGGGDGDGPGSDGSTTTGVAAIGAPIVGGTVALKCAGDSPPATTTNANGVWNATLKDNDYPCAVRVSGGTANGAAAPTLHSVAQRKGTTNITPLTDVMTAVVSGQADTEAWFDSANSAVITAAITDAKVQTATTTLGNILSNLPGSPALPANVNPLTTPFEATAGNPVDDLLEAVAASTAAAGLPQSDVNAAAVDGTVLEFWTAYAARQPITKPEQALVSVKYDAGQLTLESSTTVTFNAAGRFASTNNPDVKDAWSFHDNSIGEVCTAGEGDAELPWHSHYVYISSDWTPVTDVAELYGKTYQAYQDCTKFDKTTIDANGNSIGEDEEDNMTAAQFNAWFSTGFTFEPGVVGWGRAYKRDIGGKTVYAFLHVTNVRLVEFFITE
jgi:hypothetical protein